MVPVGYTIVWRHDTFTGIITAEIQLSELTNNIHNALRQKARLACFSKMYTHLRVFSKHLGMKTDPVFRHKELSLVQDFFL